MGSTDNMARITYTLSAITVDKLKEIGLRPDGDGLYLRITKSGTKSWIYRYSDRGRLRDMALELRQTFHWQRPGILPRSADG